MFKDEWKNIKVQPPQLKRSGITAGIIWLVLGLILMRPRPQLAWLLCVGGAFFLLTGFFYGRILGPIYKAATGTLLIISLFLTKIVLVFIYYFLVTPIAIFSRLLGKKFLDVSLKKNTNTYWIKCEEKENVPAQYEKQY
ncbi:MAG: hypothetical protein KKB82_03460 [Candidatus Omnitrophica bacterium]|nr:hypothetical protein [Candidatus Omnitrophota bacterium]MBU1924964.1 hypothetical protein [Candidatus Omnitrophota bacterium]